MTPLAAPLISRAVFPGAKHLTGGSDTRRMFAIAGVGLFLLSGCGGSSLVKIETADQNQFIARHRNDKLDEAGKQARKNCAKYNKTVVIAGSNDCYPMHGTIECMTA